MIEKDKPKTGIARKILIKILRLIAKDDLDLNPENKIPITFWLDIVLNIAIIVALVLVIRTFFISPFQVFGPSMCDTLNNIDNKCMKGYGEYIIINKFGYQNIIGWQVGTPKRGDIIVFHPPHNKEEYFIKRVIGLPGETVKLIDGYVYIFNEQSKEGFKLDEPYLNDSNKGNTHPYIKDLNTFEVPEANYFVMGDNRLYSSDSRHCFRESLSDNNCGKDPLAPFLPRPNIEGKAWIILWPLSKISAISDPTY
jgi:signal peptidase I